VVVEEVGRIRDGGTRGMREKHGGGMVELQFNLGYTSLSLFHGLDRRWMRDRMEREKRMGTSHVTDYSRIQ